MIWSFLNCFPSMLKKFMDDSIAIAPPPTDDSIVLQPPSIDQDIVIQPPSASPPVHSDSQNHQTIPKSLDRPHTQAPQNKSPSYQVESSDMGRNSLSIRAGESSVKKVSDAAINESELDEHVSPVLVESSLFTRPDELVEPDVGLPIFARNIVNQSNCLPDIHEIRSTVARLLIFGFQGKTLNSHAKKLISLGAGGVILFTRNVEDPAQVATLCSDLKKEAGSRPLLTMVDQEGGRVSRLGPPFTSIPPPELVGLTLDKDLASATATVLARELSAVNIDMDLAPVLDVVTNPSNTVIGNRSYSRKPHIVAGMGRSFVESMQRNGVAACGKHFPGHGDTFIDSHVDLPILTHDLKRLKKVELVPFSEAIDAGVAAIMMGNMAVPALDKSVEDHGRPASLSAGAVSFLREEMKFEGVIVTDCLEMGAIVKNYAMGDAAVLAFEAGVDCIMICHTEKRQICAVEAVTGAVLSGRLAFDRILNSVARLERLTKRFVSGKRPKCSLDVIGCKEHQDVVANVMHHAAVKST